MPPALQQLFIVGIGWGGALTPVRSQHLPEDLHAECYARSLGVAPRATMMERVCDNVWEHQRILRNALRNRMHTQELFETSLRYEINRRSRQRG